MALESTISIISFLSLERLLGKKDLMPDFVVLKLSV